MHERPQQARLFAVAAAIVVFLVSSAAAQPGGELKGGSKRVIVLHSFGRDFKPWSEYARAIRTDLERQSPWPVDIQEHSLVTARSSDEDPETAFVDYLGALFAKRLPDLIISIGAPAAAFVQRHRPHLFADTPMVFTAVDQRRVQFSALTKNDVVVAVRINYLAAFENILKVLPDTKKITVVVGTSPIEKFWKDAIAKDVASIADRVTLSWTDKLTFDELLQEAANMPPQSAIFWELMIVDAAGVVHEGNTALAQLHAVAVAPIFSYDESFFGEATVGGPILRVADTSRQTAAAAIRVLGGEKAEDIRPPPVEFGRPMFDWRQIQRWGISESKLPAGSEIYFREPSVWKKYWEYVLATTAALLIQFGLITWLIYERSRRRVAEADSLQRLNDLARLNRIATAGELSASIAHEIRQPLAAIVSSGSAGLNWLQHKIPNLVEVRHSLETIIKAGHRADEVIKGIRAMFQSEVTARSKVDINEMVKQVLVLVKRPIESNGITLETALAENPSLWVLADPVQLQQAVLNLVMNAIEAMSTRTPNSEANHQTRRLHIETGKDQTGNVRLIIQDSGPGFDEKIAENLFKPFVTTKPNGMGMGLSICKSIIEQHRGTLTAASIKSRGSIFQIILPQA
jgi:signal transduction histidine kinase